MTKLIFILLFIIINLLAENNSSDSNESNGDWNLKQQEISQKQKFLMNKLKVIETKLEKNSIWLREYHNHIQYHTWEKELIDIKQSIEKLLKEKKTQKIKEIIDELNREKDRLKSELELLKEFKEIPFGDFTKPIQLDEPPEVTNPIVVISALSYIKLIRQEKSDYSENYKDFILFIQKLIEKRDTIVELIKLKNNINYQKKLNFLNRQIKDLEDIAELFFTTLNLNNKKIDEVIKSLTKDIKEQGKQTLYIGITVGIIFVISLIIKLILKRYIVDNDRYYKANKIINFTNFTIILFILLFAYLENVSYLVTVLGFASAGIAIAMKDMFMSILGWFVIVMGGSIQVGDRIKVKKDAQEFLGDVLDISPLRITLHEDVTLTTYMLNRRAGRVVFVPNNFIFSSLISNYSHSGLKTVWDGIDITITFDSNHKKATHIVKEVTKKYSKGYTDMTRKQLNKLRDKYSLRNTNVEPRVLTFIEPNGIKVSAWYLTNSYATLTLRSTISADIIDAFKIEKDIVIAYPTQTINVDSENLTIPENPRTGMI